MDYSEANYKWYRCYCCGNNHVPENCPFLLWQQTYVDNLSRRSWNFEQDECWNPHVDSYSHALNPPFISYSHVQGNSFEDGEISRREERLDRLERLAGKFLIMLEDSLKWQEDSFKRLEDCLKRLKSIIEDRDDHEVKEDLEVVIEPETCLEEIDGCLIDVQDVNSNVCDFDIHVDVSVPITTLDDSPITVMTLTDGSQIDFVGCSLFLERFTSNCLYEHIIIPLKSVIACSLKLSMIEKAQVITLIYHLYCLKRNGDELIMVFDTYD